MRILVAAAFILATGCTPESDNSSNELSVADVATTSTGEMYALEPEELAAHMQRAESGDAEAAARVAEHFSFAELNSTEQTKWLLVAAEQGHIGAMRSLIHNYASDISGHKDCQKALKWHTHAKQKSSAAELREHGIVEQWASITSSTDGCPSIGMGASQK